MLLTASTLSLTASTMLRKGFAPRDAGCVRSSIRAFSAGSTELLLFSSVGTVRSISQALDGLSELSHSFLELQNQGFASAADCRIFDSPDGTSVYINLRVPVIVLILAATAVPVELGSPGVLGFSVQPADVLQNIVGYIPVGMVLAGLTPARAILVAAAVSLLAESSQFVMAHRDPSVVDVVANVIGAAAGLAAAAWWKLRPRILLRRWMCFAAAPLAVALAAAVAATAGADLSPRGAAAPGTLEAHWRFDEPEGDKVLDSSPHGLHGTARRGPQRVPGVHGGAIAFDGVDDYVDSGRPAALRLTGSISVSAWIKARANPADDAVIVSTVGRRFGDGHAFGFQLDTTVDRGPRTIGFKMGDVCGNLAIRYGATPLQLDTWYHVAGVYDARARTLDVYLDGQPDNGFLRGTVPGARRSSRNPLYIGKRIDIHGFEFAGAIDDVRIYSRSLTRDEVVADMKQAAAIVPSGDPSAGGRGEGPAPSAEVSRCSWSAEPEDARLPAAAAAMGMLICVAAMGLWRSRGRALGLALSAAGGLLLFHVATPTLPPFNAWTFPLTSLVAAASVIASALRCSPPSDGADVSTNSSHASRQSG